MGVATLCEKHARMQRGRQGVRTHSPENHKNIRFLSNPEKPQSCQASIQFWVIVGTPAKHHLPVYVFAGGPVMARF